MNLHEPIFVCGVGRSGTSLVQSMLASHPEVAVPPETSFLRRYVITGRIEQRLRRGGLEAVKVLLLDDPKLQRLEIDLDRLLNEWDPSAETLPGAGIYRGMLRLQQEMDRGTRVGDKDPRMIEFLPVLERVLPGSWVVHVVRDPRDVLVSRRRASWSSGRSTLAHLFAIQVQLTLGDIWGEKLGPRYVTLRYEDLITRPRETLEVLCRWIHLEFSPKMLEFSTTAARLVAPEELQWKKRTLGPLLTQNFGTWRVELDPRDVMLVEALCTASFDRFGYERSATRSSGAAALVLKKLFGAAGYFYRIHRKRTVRSLLTTESR